jgi:HD-GYP domain
MTDSAMSANIAEEYYQIGDSILASFPKYRPPLDLFRLKEDVAQVQLFKKKEERLSNEQVEELAALCKAGNLFVSRIDFPIYSRLIVKQLDLVLVDSNLREHEIADIALRALAGRLEDFFAQPVKPTFDALYGDVQVFTEYIWQDKNRLLLFIPRLSTGHYSLVNHSLNTLCLGAWLLTVIHKNELHRKKFDRTCMALLLHDIGMTRVPAFITSKTTPLKPDEKEKIPPHPTTGMRILEKLDLIHDEFKQIVLEHHERTDGSGYPQKMHGDRLSLLGGIAAVVDSFSAMIQKRPYAPAKPPLEAAKELASVRDKYDTTAVKTLLTAYATNDFTIPGHNGSGEK